MCLELTFGSFIRGQAMEIYLDQTCTKKLLELAHYLLATCPPCPLYIQSVKQAHW